MKTLLLGAILGSCLLLPNTAEARRNWGTDDGDWLVALDFRGAIGGSQRIRSSTRYGIAGDFDLGMRIGLEPNPGSQWVFSLLPEVGLSYFRDIRNDQVEDLYFAGGVGVGWFRSGFILGVIPKVVAGQFLGGAGRSQRAVGIRVMAIAEFLFIAGIQVGAQVVSLEDGSAASDLRATVSINLLPIVAWAWAH